MALLPIFMQIVAPFRFLIQIGSKLYKEMRLQPSKRLGINGFNVKPTNIEDRERQTCGAKVINGQTAKIRRLPELRAAVHQNQ